MRHFISLLSSTAGAATVALFGVSAAAHIELVDPVPRYSLPSNKSCPCGDGDSNRRCQQTAEESTDPNRSTQVTTFEAGSTITVIADEYVDHAGRMRVAFDPDGADLADFNAHILVDEPDLREAGLSTANPHVWELQVQLPSEPCDNCTLQVIQVMNGNTLDKVLDPAPMSTYYSCADIRIVPAGTLEDGSTASEGEGGAAATGPAASAAGSVSSAGGSASSAGGSTGAGVPSVSEADADSDESGCAISPADVDASSAWGLVALGGVLSALGLRRRPR